MYFKTGCIYHFKPCKSSFPVKNKYAICMSEEKNWFYLINSCSETPPIRPYSHEKGLVIILNEFQVKPLSHKSYLNVKKLITISSDDYDECREYEKVSNKVWLEIRKLCLDKLPKHITDIIFKK